MKRQGDEKKKDRASKQKGSFCHGVLKCKVLTGPCYVNEKYCKAVDHIGPR